jgi:hypothetical protein
MYTIRNIKNGVYKQVHPFDLEFVRSKEDDVKVYQIKQDIKSVVFDELMDKYNDLVLMHQIFGDRDYLDRAETIMKEMKKVD